MVDVAANRALRTMDLIPFILENPGISIENLANQFSVTEKQIEDDLQLVFMCGLPGYTPYELIDLVFEDGVVSIIDPQVLDKPRRFSKSELVVIVLGLQILGELNNSNSVRANQIKALSDKIMKLGNSNSVLINSGQNNSPYVDIVLNAISLRKSLIIEYHSMIKDEITNRIILPRYLYFLNGNLYLNALDLDAKADRVFKLNLIKKCEVGSATENQTYENNEYAIQVVLDIDKQFVNFIERNSSVITNIQENKDSYRVDLMVSNMEWLKRSILSYSPGITVISPVLLATQVREVASSLMSAYQNIKAI
jgi:predicted DNA-binding transcriptional regulator YafY